MRKHLFLACALALGSFVGASAQDWCRTLATGTEGKQITHEVNGTNVTQYRAETALIENAGATGVRYTVFQTGAINQIKGGGPCFALGELIVLNAAGDTIEYTVDSNADHNTMGGAGNDGAGMPALNDGILNNYFHSTWNEANAPAEYHYIEMTFAETVDAYQLVWYTRPNQHQNRPLVIGLSNPGVTFTEDMLFSEYGFSLGEEVTSADQFANGGCFTFYVEGEAEFVGSDNETHTGPGAGFVSLSGYNVAPAAEAGPQNIVQFIPAGDGKFVLYQPVAATYYGSPDKWTDGYNGSNGWQRATSDATRLGEFEFTKRTDGEFEITTYATRQYVEGAWVDFDEPLKLWVGYDYRGNLKTFPESEKNLLDAGGFGVKFGMPVDFGFKLNVANVDKTLVPDLTVAEMCVDILTNIIEVAKEKQEEYVWYSTEDYDWDGWAEALEVALEEAEAAKNGEEGLAAAFAAKEALEAAIVGYVANKANYYAEEFVDELEAEYNANKAEQPYTQEDTGKYTAASKEFIDQIADIAGDIQENYKDYTYAQIEAKYEQIEALVELFRASTLYFSTFPEIVSDIPATIPAEYPNNAVWKQNVVLAGSAISGVRLTFLDRHIGSAGDDGNFPMIALGEVKLYDGEGNEVALTADNFYANHTETQEGFESTVARLCDGVWGQGDGVTADGEKATGSYYHSPWSGSEPQEYIYLDITFPEAMDMFAVEVFSRDKSTSQNVVSLFPKKVAITKVGEAYDPALFAENPYGVAVLEKVTAVDQITADGLYVIKGLLNTQSVKVKDEETGNTVDSEPDGKAMFYNGMSRFHANEAAVREAGVYRFVPGTDGTFKALSLSMAKYWPSTDKTGFVANTTGATYEAAKAANLNIVASENVEGAFVMYEYHEGLKTEGDSIDTDEDGLNDAVKAVYETPYVVFMDWYSGLATRPVTDPQPLKDGTTLDAWGDSLCFNKANGEGEWEIYKVKMENPDFYWLTNMVGVVEGLGLVIGTDPGCVSDLGDLEDALAEGQRVVADSVYADAPAAAAALAGQIAAVATLEKNPMEPGVYQVVSVVDFAETKALYATVDEAGEMTFGWKSLVENDIQFYFDFQKSLNAEDLVSAGTITEEQGELLYTLRAIATYEGNSAYYVGEADGQSKQIDLFWETSSDYLVLNNVGSAFSIAHYSHPEAWCIHANGHGGGQGTGSNIVYWNDDAGASQWYLRRVDYETSVEDVVVEGAEVVSVSYFTPAGAAVPAPVKGINVVVTVYANGVVETKKIFVK